jgi:hypothetical protein
MFDGGLKSMNRVAERTVGIFSALLNKQLVLQVSAGATSTDGYNLFVCKPPHSSIAGLGAAELFYRQVEHCLAHIVFGANPNAKNLFVSHYTQAIENVCKVDGVTIDSVRLTLLINSIVTIIEDARVLSNWGKLYLGSAGDLKIAKKVLCRSAVRGENGLLSLLVRIAGGEVIDWKYTRGLVQEVDRALATVRGTAFGTTLYLTKWLITRMVDLVSEQKHCSRVEALEYLVSCTENQLPTAFTAYFVNLVEDPWGVSTDKMKQDNNLVSAAINARVDITTLENLDLADTGKKEMRKLVKSISTRLGTIGNRLTQSVYTANLPAKIVITDSVGDQNGYTEPTGSLVTALRTHFIRVLGRKLNELDEYGTWPDLSAVIQQRVSGNRQPVWTSTRKHRGFTALILVDLSESIKDSVLAINRSAAVLRAAMDFSFSEILVWGFQSLDDGRVDIVRLANGQIDEKSVGGLTPLHLAINVAADFLSRTDNATHLFIVTDGHPVFVDTSGLMLDTEYIVRDVGKAVKCAREKGVGVSSLVISTNETLAKNSLETMFGAFGYWLSASGDLDKHLVSIVTRSFEKYLRSS